MKVFPARTIAGMFGGDYQSLLIAVWPPALLSLQYCSVVLTKALSVGKIAKRAKTSNIYEVVFDFNIIN